MGKKRVPTKSELQIQSQRQAFLAEEARKEAARRALEQQRYDALTPEEKQAIGANWLAYIRAKLDGNTEINEPISKTEIRAEQPIPQEIREQAPEPVVEPEKDSENDERIGDVGFDKRLYRR